MCLFGGGGGGGQPQIVYKDAPVAPLPAPLPTPMASGVAEPASGNGTTESTKNTLGTSIFKINRDPSVDSSEYEDQGLDSGLYY